MKQNQLPKVSIIVPLYNNERYIEECIKSIVNQTMTDWECIVVDDGSTDDGKAIVSSMTEKDSRFTLHTQKNAGASSARNKGIKLSTGENILFIDSDDIIDNQMVEKLVLSKRANKADISICRYNTFSTDVNKTLGVEEALLPDVVEVGGMRDIIFNISSPSIFKMMFSRRLIFDNQLAFDTELVRGEDLLFGCQALVLAKRVCVLDEQLYHYRINVNSSVVSQNTKRNMTTLIALKKLKKFLESKKIYKTYKASYQRLLSSGVLLFDYENNKKLFIDNYKELHRFALDVFGGNSDTASKLAKQYKSPISFLALIDSKDEIKFFSTKSELDDRKIHSLINGNSELRHELAKIRNKVDELQKRIIELENDLQTHQAMLDELDRIKPSAKKLASNIKRQIKRSF